MKINPVELTKWDRQFFLACEMLAEWSTCLSQKIGVVLVRENTIISTGFNGPPRGVPHCGKDRIIKDNILSEAFKDKAFDVDRKSIDTTCPRQILGYKSGQGLHLCPASHAEENAIVNAARTGVSTLGTTMFMSCGVPCKDCMKKIINAGIVEIVCGSLELYDSLSKYLLDNSTVKMRLYRKEGE